MHLEERELTYRAVREYLLVEDPEEAEDLDLVFADVYGAIDRRVGTSAGGSDADREGLGFDTGFMAGTVITIAIQIALVLAKAALKDSMERDAPAMLDRAEGQLIEWTGKAKLVAQIRKRIEGILKNL